MDSLYGQPIDSRSCVFIDFDNSHGGNELTSAHFTYNWLTAIKIQSML